jgi:hypothetical protein
MPKPVCVPCQRFFRPLRNGVVVLEQKPIANDAKPGFASPEKWVPYKLWRADAWQCFGCGTIIISGYGDGPVWENHHGPLPVQPDYIVNDC